MNNHTETQKQKILKALKKGLTLDWLKIYKLSGSSKGSSRIGEIETEYSLDIKRGWKKLGGVQVRTYKLARV